MLYVSADSPVFCLICFKEEKEFQTELDNGIGLDFCC